MQVPAALLCIKNILSPRSHYKAGEQVTTCPLLRLAGSPGVEVSFQWNVYGEFPESRTERDQPSSDMYQAGDHTETNKALNGKAKVIVMGTGLWSVTNTRVACQMNVGARPQPLPFDGRDPLSEMAKFVDDHKRRSGEKVTSVSPPSPLPQQPRAQLHAASSQSHSLPRSLGERREKRGERREARDKRRYTIGERPESEREALCSSTSVLACVAQISRCSRGSILARADLPVRAIAATRDTAEPALCRPCQHDAPVGPGRDVYHTQPEVDENIEGDGTDGERRARPEAALHRHVHTDVRHEAWAAVGVPTGRE